MLAPNVHLRERYRILHKIGGGGFGYVYKAMDEVFGCSVAIKETREEVANQDKLRKAFEREAKLLRNLKHDSLPRVTDYFFHNGAQFLVMDFIEGEDLASRLKQRLCEQRGPFSCQELLPLADKILAALEYLHSRPDPIIHRDIKPSNIKLTDDGEVYLLDFGLAKGVTGQMSTVVEGQTSSSVPGFTREYAPLEQMQDTETEPQSDIYAFGATLYHLLTGHLPVSATRRDEALQRKQNDPLRPAHEVNPAISSLVSQVLSQALAVRWWDRIGSVKEMRAALNRACEESVTPQPSLIGQGASPPVSLNANEKISTLPHQLWHEITTSDSVESTTLPKTPTRSRPPARAWLKAWRFAALVIVVLSGLAFALRIAFPHWFTAPIAPQPEARKITSLDTPKPIIATPAELHLTQPLGGHTGIVWAVAFSPDGRFAASASKDHTIILWATKTWTPTKLIGHAGEVYTVSFSPDSKTLASGGDDKTIKLWNTENGQVIKTLPPEHTKPVIRLAFSADGDFLASVGSAPGEGDKEIRLWDARSWNSGTLEGHQGTVSAIAFSPDKQTLASAGYDGTLRLWAVRSKTPGEVLKLSGPQQSCAALAFSADGKYLACGGSDNTIKLWLYQPETHSWRELEPLKAHTQPLTSIAFSPDNKTLVSASEDNTLRLWDVTARNSKLLSTGQGEKRVRSWAVAFSPDGQTLLTGGDDNKVYVWQ